MKRFLLFSIFTILFLASCSPIEDIDIGFNVLDTDFEPIRFDSIEDKTVLPEDPYRNLYFHFTPLVDSLSPEQQLEIYDIAFFDDGKLKSHIDLTRRWVYFKDIPKGTTLKVGLALSTKGGTLSKISTLEYLVQ